MSELLSDDDDESLKMHHSVRGLEVTCSLVQNSLRRLQLPNARFASSRRS